MAVIKAIKPRIKSSMAKQAMTAIERVNTQTAEAIVKNYNRTTNGWSDRPKPIVWVGRDRLEARMDSQVWNWLDKGTRPHRIEPKKRAGLLRFRTGYVARTRPGSLDSGAGGANGPFVFSRGVNHPGTKPRKWTKKIQEIASRDYSVLMAKAMEGLA